MRRGRGWWSCEKCGFVYGETLRGGIDGGADSHGQGDLVDGVAEAKAVVDGDVEIAEEIIENFTEGIGAGMSGRRTIFTFAYDDGGGFLELAS